MLDPTWTEFILIRIAIFFLQSTGPFSIAYLLSIVWTSYTQSTWPALSLFRAYCLAEAAFYGFIYFYRIHLQREAIHPPLRSREQRRALFDKARSEIHDVNKFLSGWFRGAKVEDIGRDGLKQYLNWAFWEGRALDDDTGEKELEEYTVDVETMLDRKFVPGEGKAKSIRLTLDPIEMDCRCLSWYMIILMLDTVTQIRLWGYGFKYYHTSSTSLAVFPPRPGALLASGRSPADRLAYWLKPHTSTKRLPIVFIHGIGIGLWPSVDFLHEIDSAVKADEHVQDDGEVGILAVEILQISSRLTFPILGQEQFLEAITHILDAHNFDRFILASHSFGSVMNTHMLLHEPLANRIASTVFIDPVTILLHMPDVAYNFTVRPPRYANEWQLWYFASKDPGVAHTLGRHFFWSDNLMWRERLVELVDRGMNITVSLASRDLIVDAQAVGSYLTEHLVPDPVLKEDATGRKQMELAVRGSGTGDLWKRRPWQGRGLEVMWWEDLDHAQVFDTKDRRAKLVDIIVKYSKCK